MYVLIIQLSTKVSAILVKSISVNFVKKMDSAFLVTLHLWLIKQVEIVSAQIRSF